MAYHITDHIGSVRSIIKNGTIVEQNDYYPFGGRLADASLPQQTTPVANRWRFSGKEDLSVALGDPVLDFGARMYSPSGAMWLTQDPMAEKYYCISPYAYCAGDPVNRVDPDGEAWFYNKNDGSFVFHVKDDDDSVYLLTNEQVINSQRNNGKYKKSQIMKYRDTQNRSNCFGNIAISEETASNILTDFYKRAMCTEENGVTTYNVPIPIVIAKNVSNPNSEQVNSTTSHVTAYLQTGRWAYGYDIINLFSHEICHTLQRLSIGDKNKFMIEQHNNLQILEINADLFSMSHWSYSKTSKSRKETIMDHLTANGY